MNQKVASTLRRVFQTGMDLPKPNEIDLRLQQRATDQTCAYIEQTMTRVNPVATPFKVLETALDRVSVKDGLYLEFGVFRGATINFIASKIPAEIHGFDSFEGLPEFWRDGFDKGAFGEKQGLPPVASNVTLYKGWFNETIPPFADAHRQPIAFLHVDCDLYSSTVTIFQNLGGQIVPGTVIAFDEYFNYPGWQEGEFKAFKELVSERNIRYEYLTYNKKHEQVAVKILDIA
jgi:hypothetical protein